MEISILILPLLASIISGLFGKYIGDKYSGYITSVLISISAILSIVVFYQVIFNQYENNIVIATWINSGSLVVNWSMKIDPLSSVMLVVVSLVSSLVHVYSIGYMHHDPHKPRFMSYLSLFTFSMLMLVTSDNLIQLFFGWEGVGLCSYFLIGFWFKRESANSAAIKAFIVNRIGDFGLAIGIFLIFYFFGTVNYSEVFALIPTIVDQEFSFLGLEVKKIDLICLLLFIGAMGKSAQIFLHTWLPDAMEGPTPVSALIHAATMVTAGVFLVVRCSPIYEYSPVILNFITIVGMTTAFFAATVALVQTDIKKIIAYSTCSQLGYMFFAAGVGAYNVAMFHLFTHAFFKALLFLGSGSVIHAMSGDQDIRNMGGLSKQLKITYATFLIGCFAIAGIPPLSGFFSKDAILLSAFEKSPVLYWLALVGALLTAFYMFRLFFLTFSGKFRGTELQKENIHESPMAMTIPLVVLAVLSIVGGFIGIPEIFIHGGDRLSQFLSPIIGTQNKLTVSHATEYLLMGLSTILIIATILFARNKFTKYQPTTESELGKLIENKWLVDELYNKIIVNPINQLARVLNDVFEKSGIDAVVNGVGKVVHYSSRQIRLLQNGLVGNYILLMIISMIIIFTFQFFLKK